MRASGPDAPHCDQGSHRSLGIDIGACFSPCRQIGAVYRVVGIRADGLLPAAWHALLVARTPDQGALAVPLEILNDPRYWTPVD